MPSGRYGHGHRAEFPVDGEAAPAAYGSAPAAKASPFGRKPSLTALNKAGPATSAAAPTKYTGTAKAYKALPEVVRLQNERSKKTEFLKRRESIKQLDQKWRARTKAMQGDAPPKHVLQPPMVYGTY